ncbi:MAG TPA: hypothetical protein VF808_08280 [Ktedonobacterales bacterium]
MKWFRLYSSVLHDPKAQRLSPALFKYWINLLCLANEGEPRGALPSVEDIAFALRVKPGEAGQILSQLRGAGLIDQTLEGRDFPHNWMQRQRRSDDVAARVAEHRWGGPGKQAESSRSVDGSVTLPVTRVKRQVDKDTEEETEKDPTSGRDSIVDPGIRTAKRPEIR